MRRTRISPAVLLILTLASPLAAQVPAEVAAGVDRVFERWNSTATPGCAVGVSRNGRMELARAYGMADLEHDVRNSPQTIFEAGSVSKQFTAAAIVMLALDGRLSLDDDVRKYVPELPDYGKRLTIRHMMNHTSGLRDWGSVAEIAGWGRGSRVHTHAHVLDIVSRQRGLNFDPGHEYSYSNTGYNLQAVIVERVSGMSFADFTRQRIFEPVGMKNTQWRDDFTRIVKGRATAYSERAGGFALSMPFENVHGNGGLLTTVEDLLIWNENLETGRVGGPRFLQLMHEQGVLNSGERIAYASGLQIGSFRGVPQVSHTGSTAGYRAFLARYPQQKLGVALLCNVGSVNPGRVGEQVAAVLLPEAAPRVTTGARPTGDNPAAENQQGRGQAGRQRSAVAIDPALLNDYAGEYYSPDAEVTYHAVVQDGSLYFRRRPDTRLVLESVGDDTFRTSGLGTIRFIRDGSGHVTQFSVQQARVYDLRFDRVR
jgi:CubicO group peptidase (beta-lactamase class C family)